MISSATPAHRPPEGETARGGGRPPPRLVVQIEWGRMRGRKALIEPGRTLRIGRFERADLAVPHDEELSGLHVELTWDGARCLGRDLGSQRGTEWNGEGGPSAELVHQDWFRAGSTFFSVHVERLAPLGIEPPPLPPEVAARRPEALTALAAEEAPLYAIVDAAQDERPLTLFASAPEEVASLYDGEPGEELAEAAPYLAPLPRGSWLLERLVEEGWGRGWCVFLTCRRPFAEVRRHLRRLLIVEERETGAPLYFRFYDPLVLPEVVGVASPRQLQQLYGDVEAFLVETRDGGLLRLPRPDFDLLSKDLSG